MKTSSSTHRRPDSVPDLVTPQRELRIKLCNSKKPDSKDIRHLIHLCRDRKNISAMQELAEVHYKFPKEVRKQIPVLKWPHWEKDLLRLVEPRLIKDMKSLSLDDLVYFANTETMGELACREMFSRMISGPPQQMREQAALRLYRLHRLANTPNSNGTFDRGLLNRMEAAARRIVEETHYKIPKEFQDSRASLARKLTMPFNYILFLEDPRARDPNLK